MRFPLITMAVMAAALSVSAAQAVEVNSCAEGNSYRTFLSDATSRTQSRTFRALPGAVLAVLGSSASCAIVQFSALVDAPGGLAIRLTRDGKPAGFPAAVPFFTPGHADTRAARIVQQLNPGTGSLHTFRIEFASLDGHPVSIGNYVIILGWRD